MVQLSQWKSEQMVFVDESAVNERTADRKWGWAPIANWDALSIRTSFETNEEVESTSSVHRKRFSYLGYSAGFISQRRF